MLKVESYKKGIVLSTFFNILNKGLVFCNGLLVAYFFGVHSSTDLFFYLYNSVLIVGAFFTSMNSSVLIPESMRIRVREGEIPAMRFLNFFIYLYALLVAASVLLVAFHPILFFSAVSNFDDTDLAGSRMMLYLSLPLFAMICVINLLIDILTSHKFFTVPMIVGIVNGSVSVLFVVVFHHRFGINSVFYGLLISYTVNLIMLLSLMKIYVKWDFLHVGIVREKRIWNNFGFAQLGNITSTLSSYTPIYILSGFNAGILTALTFAQQISSLPTALVTSQFSSVAGIKFNELYASGNLTALNKVFSESADFLHFLMIPLGLFIFSFSGEIVQVLLGFSSLNPATSETVTLFLKYLGLMLPLMVVNTLISRLFMASHKIRQSFAYQVIFNITLISCLYLSVKQFGIIGYPMAMLFTYMINLFFCYSLEKKYFGFIDYVAVLRQFFILVAVNLAIIIAVYYSIKFAGIQYAFLTLAAASLMYFLVLLIINKTFRINELVFLHLNDILKKLFNYGSSRSRQ